MSADTAGVPLPVDLLLLRSLDRLNKKKQKPICWSIAVGCTAGLIHWPIKKQGSKCHMQGGLVERAEGVGEVGVR